MTLPVLVAIATHNRLAMTQACFESLKFTTQPDEVEISFVDNGSTDGTVAWLAELEHHDPRVKRVIYNRINEGTARAINRAWRFRQPGQPALKLDNDAVLNTIGWVPRMLKVFDLIPVIGLIGFKRQDLAERAAHPGEAVKPPSFYISRLYELSNHELIEVSNHVMGTCTMYSPRALETIGDLYQMQDIGNLYGFDDSLACLRLRIAGLQCCFLRGVLLDHIDPGESGSAQNAEHTIWKREQAGHWMSEYTRAAEEFQGGLRPIYWKDNLD